MNLGWRELSGAAALGESFNGDGGILEALADEDGNTLEHSAGGGFGEVQPVCGLSQCKKHGFSRLATTTTKVGNLGAVSERTENLRK
jgi:hypothetical protein